MQKKWFITLKMMSLLSPKMVGKLNYSKDICRGCKDCIQGKKLVLFIGGKCNVNCWYCSLSELRKNSPVLWANEKKCKSILSSETENDLRYMLIYAVQQSLEFALNPISVASPVETILAGKIKPIKGIQEDSEGCLAVLCRRLSLDTCFHNDLLPQ